MYGRCLRCDKPSRIRVYYEGDSMTKKRFKHHMGLICEKRDEEYYSFTIKEVCDLLNALYEENQALKSDRVRYEEECRLDVFKELSEENEQLKETIKTQNFNYKNAKGIIYSSEHQIQRLQDENEQLKSQLYCDDEEGICNICKHHYLVKDDEAELGYYNSRCKMGHYECARISLKHCDDFELRGDV